MASAHTPPPPPVRETPTGPRRSAFADDKPDETSEHEVWKFLDQVSDEAMLRRHLKSSTPGPGGTDLVMLWRMKGAIERIDDKASNTAERVSNIEGMLQVLLERGQWAKHLATVCSSTSNGVGRVVESVVSDVWVKRTLAFAILLAVMGHFGFTYFNASKGDATVNIGTESAEERLEQVEEREGPAGPLTAPRVIP